MILPHLSRRPVRALLFVLFAAALGIGLSALRGGASPATANPAYGNIRLVPGSQFVIQGYKFSVQVGTTTCGTGTDTYCHVGAYDIVLNYDATKFARVTDSGTSTGGNTTTKLVDTTKSWKINQWAGSRVTITGGSAVNESRLIVSNTKTALTVTPAWDPFPAVLPDNTSAYALGGMTDSGGLGSTGRSVTCPVGATYGTGWAELHCISLGAAPPDGPMNTTTPIPLTNLTLVANNRGLVTLPFTLPPNNPATQILTIEGNAIPADVTNGARRVILCPDSNGDGNVNSTDLSQIAQAFGKRTGQVGYATTKDPDESGVVNSTDLLITASVFNNRCTQP